MRPILRLLLASLFIGIFLSSHAQKEYTDSLLKRFRAEKSDTEQVRLMVQLGNRLRLSDSAESWRCKFRIDSIYERTKKPYFKAQSVFLHATILINSNPTESIGQFEIASTLFDQFPNHLGAQLSKGAAMINLGVVHMAQSDYENAIKYYRKAENIYLQYNPNNGDVGLIYSNLSIAYGAINKYEEGILYSKKGLDRAYKLKDEYQLMAALYSHAGNLINAKKGTDGLKQMDSAKALAEKFQDLNYIYSCDFMKGMYYYNTKQFREAITQYTYCLEFARKYNFIPGIGNNFLNIAAQEAELKMPRQAAAHLDSATKYLDLKTPSVSKQMYFENYAEVYRQLGQFDKAFSYKDSVAAIKDSLYRTDNIKQLEFRQARYNYDKKQNEITQLQKEKQLQNLELKQKNLFNGLLILGVLALISIGVLFYRNVRQKQLIQVQKINELEKEKQLLAAEAVLKGEEKERTRLAKDLHDGLGGMLSGIKYTFNTMKGNLVMTPDNQMAFERGMDMLDSSIKEMRRVAHNMMPEALVKFGLDTAMKDLIHDINQTGAVNATYQSIGISTETFDQTTAINIYRILQELLNNSMKHAAASTILIQLSQHDDRINLTFEDNGKGFDPAIIDQNTGMGWSNIKNRVQFLKGNLQVDSKPGQGCSINIEFNRNIG